MAGTKIMQCSCKHTWQDSKYGAGMRVHNVANKAGASSAKCTVCGNKVVTAKATKAAEPSKEDAAKAKQEKKK